MTPLALLAEARSRGITIAIESPRHLRARGPSEALDELRDRLAAVKPELIELLVREQRASEVRAATDEVQQRVTQSTAAWPLGGMATLARLAPDLSTQLAVVEIEADQLAAVHVAVGRKLTAYREALGRWHDLLLTGAAILAASCHDCGRRTTVALVDPADGSRYCGRCSRPSEAPIVAPELASRVPAGGGS